MQVYEVIFLGGSSLKVFANSPNEAQKNAEKRFPELQVIRIQNPKCKYFLKR